MVEPEMPPAAAIDEESTAELIRAALEDVRDLARAEVALAGKELGTEVRDIAVVSLVAAASIAIGVCAAALAVAALIINYGGTLVAAFGTAAGLLAIVAAGGVVLSVARAPRGLLPRTRDRVAQNISQVKDHFA